MICCRRNPDQRVKMSESIYAPPEADVSAPPEEEAPRYYVVAPFKFMLLSIMTFGLYFVYWFYKNWQMIKVRDGDDSWPVARAIFYIFFTHSLCTDIDIRARERDPHYSWGPGTIATAFVALSVISNLIDRIVPDEYFDGPMLLATLSPVLILPMILLQAQKAINFACRDDRGNTNRRITASNIAWIIVFAIVWIVVIIGVIATFDPTFLAE